MNWQTLSRGLQETLLFKRPLGGVRGVYTPVTGVYCQVTSKKLAGNGE